MELTFEVNSNWKLSLLPVDIQQHDNLTNIIKFVGCFSSEFNVYKALIKHKNHLDEIPLHATEEGYAATLTGSHLAFSGIYEIQLKAEAGDKVKHTNVIYFPINRSLSGDEQWPTIPTAFTEAVKAAEEAQEASEEAQRKAEDAQEAAEKALHELQNNKITSVRIDYLFGGI